ncbi:hypothetical protein GCK72_019780 [Caenorhabditis remanei]|uniref:Seven TM Receptor n=1 Tax=Caenorhabditis remanei TaxID=31234 RepID=A0A6A5GER0_CAERE|nr:hypothetical protein GCK72_019780 [Caenorhabditis remanei]KAF1753224.1 hypothetical protein GCK72_019780 [Caenorhabditis remanei]
MQSWLPIFNKIQRGATCFGMAVNAFLVPLIIFRSPKDLGLYKYLMIYISCFEIFFGCVELLIIPDFFTKDSAFFVMVDPRKTIVPESLIQEADLLFCGSFAVSLGIFGFQFAYRYQVLRGNAAWTSSRPINFIFWLGSPLVFASVWTTALGIFMPLNNYGKAVLIRESIFPSDVDLDKIGFVGALFYPKLDDGTEVINWDSLRGVSVTTTILMSSEFAMFFFATKCFLATKGLMAQAGHSKSFRRLQWQLFYALVLQTMIPITFIQGPFSVIYFFTIIMDGAFPFLGHFLALTITLYLATDALPTIFIIKQYRDTVLSTLSEKLPVS